MHPVSAHLGAVIRRRRQLEWLDGAILQDREDPIRGLLVVLGAPPERVAELRTLVEQVWEHETESAIEWLLSDRAHVAGQSVADALRTGDVDSVVRILGSILHGLPA